MAKVNLIQSRLDILNLASYPERAKQIFVKVIIDSRKKYFN
jgi:hypothetical protein